MGGRQSAQLARGSGFGTLCLIAAFTAAASAVLDNVTVVVLTIPITLSVCRTLNVDPVPLLLAQIFASNIGGVSTVIAHPPNIIISAAADIGFVDFMLNAAPVSIVSMVVLLVALYAWFRNQVRHDGCQPRGGHAAERRRCDQRPEIPH